MARDFFIGESGALSMSRLVSFGAGIGGVICVLTACAVGVIALLVESDRTGNAIGLMSTLFGGAGVCWGGVFVGLRESRPLATAPMAPLGSRAPLVVAQADTVEVSS